MLRFNPTHKQGLYYIATFCKHVCNITVFPLASVCELSIPLKFVFVQYCCCVTKYYSSFFMNHKLNKHIKTYTISGKNFDKIFNYI